MPEATAHCPHLKSRFTNKTTAERVKESNKKKMAGAEATVFLPREYGYVATVIVLYSFFNIWMAGQVVKARKKFNVPFPTLYASESENKDAKLFNCIQRGHQQSLEMLPMFFATLIVGGLRHPTISAALGLIYIVARYFFFTGYATGVPDNRLKFGKFAFFALFGLLICTISLAVHLLLG